MPQASWITPRDIARRAAMILHDNASELTRAGICSMPATQELGDVVQVSIPGMLEESITVSLDGYSDVCFEVNSVELTGSMDDFAVNLLGPAMSAIAEHINTRISDADTPVCLVSAPLGVPQGQYGAHGSSGGVHVRAVLSYDIGVRRYWVTVDTLYGVTPVEIAATV